jgi:bacterioferritin
VHATHPEKQQTMTDFTIDIERIRNDARRQTELGAVTPDYRADRETVIRMLDAALATEWLCVLRYTQHRHAAQGINAQPVADHFAEHARQEQEHAESLADRIKQLGGMPKLDPATLSGRAHSQYKEADSLAGMIRENLVAERIAIESYGEMIRYLGDRDPTTRRMLEQILAVEEEHADDMADLLAAYDPREKLN